MLADWKLTDAAYRCVELCAKLAENVDAHETKRRQVSAKRGYECGHAAEWYWPREATKTAIKREIKELRRELMGLSRMLDRAPGRME